MSTVELAEGTISVDATLIARDLGLDPAHVLDALRAGRLTTLCEEGIAEDAGHLRLTLYLADRRLRLIIDREGRVLQRSAARLRRRLSGSARGIIDNGQTPP